MRKIALYSVTPWTLTLSAIGFFVESGPLITYLVTGFDVVDIVEMD